MLRQSQKILLLLLSLSLVPVILTSCSDNDDIDENWEDQFEANLPTDTIDDIFYIAINGNQFQEKDELYLTPEEIKDRKRYRKTVLISGAERFKAKVYKTCSPEYEGIDIKNMWISSVEEGYMPTSSLVTFFEYPAMFNVEIKKYSTSFLNAWCAIDINGDEILIRTSETPPFGPDNRQIYLKIGITGVTTNNKLFQTDLDLRTGKVTKREATDRIDAYIFEHPDTIVSSHGHSFRMSANLDREIVRETWDFQKEIDFDNFGSVDKLKFFTCIKEFDATLPETWEPWYSVHDASMVSHGFEYDYNGSLTNFHSEWATLSIDANSIPNLAVNVALEPNTSGKVRKYRVDILGHAETCEDRPFLHEHDYFGHFTITQLSE